MTDERIEELPQTDHRAEDVTSLDRVDMLRDRLAK